MFECAVFVLSTVFLIAIFHIYIPCKCAFAMSQRVKPVSAIIGILKSRQVVSAAASPLKRWHCSTLCSEKSIFLIAQSSIWILFLLDFQIKRIYFGVDSLNTSDGLGTLDTGCIGKALDIPVLLKPLDAFSR